MPVPQPAISRGNGRCSDCSTRLATRVRGWSSPRAAAPRQLAWRLDDWRSRAGACVVYHVRELDEAGRAQALKLRAAQRGLKLPAETLEYLMKRVPRDLPSLLDICSMSSTRPRSPRSAASPSPSFATPSRSTQIQNHSAEPREYQEQAQRGDPARAGFTKSSVTAKIKYGTANSVAHA